MHLTVNGVPRDLPLSGHETLLGVLRGPLELTGTKLVCGRGECGACTVLVAPAGAGEAPPEAVYACLTLAAACEGAAVTTIEGLGTADALHPMQAAFVEHDALQCGFCTPGQILAAVALAEGAAGDLGEDEVRAGMSGNLCRCGAYPKIVRAVVDGARRMRLAAP